VFFKSPFDLFVVEREKCWLFLTFFDESFVKMKSFKDHDLKITESK
jgi:hypothetical protein